MEVFSLIPMENYNIPGSSQHQSLWIDLRFCLLYRVTVSLPHYTRRNMQCKKKKKNSFCPNPKLKTNRTGQLQSAVAPFMQSSDPSPMWKAPSCPSAGYFWPHNRPSIALNHKLSGSGEVPKRHQRLILPRGVVTWPARTNGRLAGGSVCCVRRQTWL